MNIRYRCVPYGTRFSAESGHRHADAAEGQEGQLFANEIAVDAFLNCRIRFTDIPEVIESTMNAQSVEEVSNLETVLSSDHRARAIARDHIMRLAA